ncbi:MAG: OmpA family protein, partial [Myxococcota bacterium]
DLGRVEIQGHTDNVGPSSYNRKLSGRRANAVRAYLIAKGVAGDRVLARGYGESRPRFTNRTAGGRMRNRRVQFVLLDDPDRLVDPSDATSSP